jgi:hypothetical protein
VARLRHPNLVRMLPLPGGAGLAPVLNDARRLADFTLPAGTFKRFDLEQVVRLLLDVLSGLSALHEVETDGEPFVHGEVSPQHIYVDEHGTARLVPLMNTHSMVGAKPEPNGYVAPECLLGERFDGRADVFSVGVMLWEALAGQRLFPDPSVAGVVARAAAGNVPSIRLSPRLKWAQPLCAIATRATSLAPEARFRSVLELSNAMAAAAAQQLSTVNTDAWQEEAPTPVFQPNLHLATLRAVTPPPSVISLDTPEPAKPTPVTSDDQADEPLEAWQRSRRGRGAVLGVVAALVGALAFVAPRASDIVQQLSTAGLPAALQLSPAPAARAPAAMTPPVAMTPLPAAEAPQASPSAGVVPRAPAITAPSAAVIPPAPAIAPSAHLAPPPPAARQPTKSEPPVLPATKAAPASKKRASHGADYGI